MRARILTAALLLGCTPLIAQGVCDNSASEVERANCLDAAYAHADSELNRVYQLAMRAHPDPAMRAALLASERAWVAYKESQVKLLAFVVGGNHPSEEINTYLIGLTNDRTQFLQSEIGSGGATGPPATPPANNAVYVAAMKADLRNLVTAEEAFFADSVKYTSKIGPGGINFSVTSGNSWPAIRLTRDGWTAVIANTNTPTHCAIFIGSISAPPAIKEGAPNCQ